MVRIRDQRILLAFGRVLKRVRKERGVTQLNLSLESGLDRAFIGHIERGAKKPSVITLIRICHALDMKPAEFMEILDQELNA